MDLDGSMNIISKPQNLFHDSALEDQLIDGEQYGQAGTPRLRNVVDEE